MNRSDSIGDAFWKRSSTRLNVSYISPVGSKFGSSWDRAAASGAATIVRTITPSVIHRMLELAHSKKALVRSRVSGAWSSLIFPTSSGFETDLCAHPPALS